MAGRLPNDATQVRLFMDGSIEGAEGSVGDHLFLEGLVHQPAETANEGEGCQGKEDLEHKA